MVKIIASLNLSGLKETSLHIKKVERRGLLYSTLIW